MPIKIGDFSFFVGPSVLGSQDDLEAAVIHFIEGAKRSLDVAVQELESEPIAKALTQARQRGIRVHVVLEGDYLVEDKNIGDPFALAGSKEANRELLNALHRARIDARMDYNPKIFHQKFIVRHRTAVLTGSTNFTPTGTHSNLNPSVIVRNKKVAKEYAAEFKQIWSGAFGKVRFRHRPHPKVRRVSGINVKVLFAPDHAPEMEIMKQMMKAKERIDFAIFTFSQSSGIDDTMIALAGSGIKIRGVFDSQQGNQRWAATRVLANVDAEICLDSRSRGRISGKPGKLHFKLTVIDCRVMIAGSFNYTGPANLLNDENVIVIGDAGEIDPTSETTQRR